jgi:hypothetical protein
MELTKREQDLLLFTAPFFWLTKKKENRLYGIILMDSEVKLVRFVVLKPSAVHNAPLGGGDGALGHFPLNQIGNYQKHHLLHCPSASTRLPY